MGSPITPPVSTLPASAVFSATALGVPRFFYSTALPAEAVPIAHISASEVEPSDLVSVQSFNLAGQPQGPGSYSITPVQFEDTGGGVRSGFDSDGVSNLLTPSVAPALNTAVSFSGSTLYFVKNQFFEMTDVTDSTGSPLFYQHGFQNSNPSNVSVTDNDGNAVTAFTFVNGTLYHNLNGQVYWVGYFSNGYYQRELLRHIPNMTRTANGALPAAGQYLFLASGGITMPDKATYWIRWYADNGYSLLKPYSGPLNDPWYPRVRFNLNPVPQEWGHQVFQPYAPYILAAWVRGTVLGPNLIQFERQPAYFDGTTYPDVLVYDQNYNIKYALDGTPAGSGIDKGFLFQWMKAQFISIDEMNSVVNVAVTLETTDICFAFYSYRELDYVLPVNLNPFTNPAVKNAVVEFYYSAELSEGDPYHNIFWRVLAADGVTTASDGQGHLLTNDQYPGGNAIRVVFAHSASGYSVSPEDFTFTDLRTRGGGLAPPYQTLEAARNFWDLGYWDGKPYPLGGAAAVYLPNTILAVLTRQQIAAIIKAKMAAGTMALIRYYDPATGDETI